MDEKQIKAKEEVNNFLEAFKKVSEAGFFETFSMNSLNSTENGRILMTMDIRFSGILPESKKDDRSIKESVALIDMKGIIENIWKNTEEGGLKISSFICRVDYTDLSAYYLNPEGKTVSGSLHIILKN